MIDDKKLEKLYSLKQGALRRKRDIVNLEAINHKDKHLKKELVKKKQELRDIERNINEINQKITQEEQRKLSRKDAISTGLFVGAFMVLASGIQEIIKITYTKVNIHPIISVLAGTILAVVVLVWIAVEVNKPKK